MKLSILFAALGLAMANASSELLVYFGEDSDLSIEDIHAVLGACETTFTDETTGTKTVIKNSEGCGRRLEEAGGLRKLEPGICNLWDCSGFGSAQHKLLCSRFNCDPDRRMLQAGSSCKKEKSDLFQKMKDNSEKKVKKAVNKGVDIFCIEHQA